MFDVGSLFQKSRSLVAIFTGLAVLSVAAPAFADDSSSDFKLTGFFSAVAGKTIQNNLDANYAGPTQIAGTTCPCYLADWGNAGIYSNSLSLKPESRVGLQLSYKPNTNTSFIAQIVSRGTDATPNLQWAYGGYKLNSNWEIQVGRKRIPLYYYSDFQDIGLSYPWVTPPPELYGWEVTNYNGASIRYNNNIGEMNLNASLFFGAETAKDSLYQKLYYDGKTEVSWKKIMGADLEISQGMLTMRGVYVQSDARAQIFAQQLDDTAKLRAYGLATNIDLDDWFILTEVTQLSRDFTQSQYKITAPAFTLGAGKRMGAWTPFFNFAKYTESSSDLSKYSPQSYKRTSFTLRYDLDTRSAIKGQIDRNTDVTNNFGGTTTVLRLSYDLVF